MATSEELIAQGVEILSRPFDIPQYGGTDLSQANKTAADVRSAAQQSALVNAKTRDEILMAASEQNAANLELATATSAKATADAAQAAAKAAPYVAFNVMEETQNRIAAEIAASSSFLLETKPAAQAELQNIKEMQSVGMLDDPLEWAYNQIQLPSKIKGYNAVATQMNSAQNTINVGLANIKNIADGREKNVPAITSAQAIAASDFAVATANKQNALLKEHAATVISELANKDLAAKSVAAQITNSTTHLQQTEMHNKYLAEVQAIGLQETRAGRLLKAGEQMSLYEDKTFTKDVLEVGDVLLGKPKGSTTLTAFKLLPKEDREALWAIANTGTYGANWNDSITNIQRYANANGLPETTKEIAKALINQRVVIERDIDKNFDVAMAASQGKLTPADKHQFRMNQINEGLQAFVVNEMKKPDSKFFAPATPKELLVAGVIDRESPLGKVLEPLAETNAPVDPITLEKSIRLATKGNPTATGVLLSQYYKVARGVTNQSSNITTFSKTAVLPKEYIVRVDDPTAIFGSSIPIDLATAAGATKFSIFNTLKEQYTNDPYGNTIARTIANKERARQMGNAK